MDHLILKPALITILIAFLAMEVQSRSTVDPLNGLPKGETAATLITEPGRNMGAFMQNINSIFSDIFKDLMNDTNNNTMATSMNKIRESTGEQTEIINVIKNAFNISKLLLPVLEALNDTRILGKDIRLERGMLSLLNNSGVLKEIQSEKRSNMIRPLEMLVKKMNSILMNYLPMIAKGAVEVSKNTSDEVTGGVTGTSSGGNGREWLTRNPEDTRMILDEFKIGVESAQTFITSHLKDNIFPYILQLGQNLDNNTRILDAVKTITESIQNSVASHLKENLIPNVQQLSLNPDNSSRIIDVLRTGTESLRNTITSHLKENLIPDVLQSSLNSDNSTRILDVLKTGMGTLRNMITSHLNENVYQNRSIASKSGIGGIVHNVLENIVNPIKNIVGFNQGMVPVNTSQDVGNTDTPFFGLNSIIDTVKAMVKTLPGSAKQNMDTLRQTGVEKIGTVGPALNKMLNEAWKNGPNLINRVTDKSGAVLSPIIDQLLPEIKSKFINFRKNFNSIVNFDTEVRPMDESTQELANTRDPGNTSL